jgi:hypothetical protein
MLSYILPLPGAEIVHLYRAEWEDTHRQPELDVCIWKEYIVEEGFPGGNGHDNDLVTAMNVLSIEPRVERDYWILQVIVERFIGTLAACDAEVVGYKELSLNEFEAEFGGLGHKRVRVRLDAETPSAKHHFDRWLVEMRARHPPGPHAGRPRTEAPAEAGLSEVWPGERAATAHTWICRASEAVAVLSDPNGLRRAMQELEVAGFGGGAISLLALAAHPQAKQSIERCFRPEDARCYVGGVAGVFAAAAPGRALGSTFAGAMAGRAPVGLRGLLAPALGRDHLDQIEQELSRGGIVIWVAGSDPAAGKRALGLLAEMGASEPHLHRIRQQWSVRETLSRAVRP